MLSITAVPRRSHARDAALLPKGASSKYFVDTPLEVCRRRDPKGLYEKADRGKVLNLTGRDQPYEAPEAPDLVLRTVEPRRSGRPDRLVELVMRRAGYGTSPNSAVH